MEGLEKMIKKHVSSMDVPDAYKVKVEETLNNLPQDGEEKSREKKSFYRTRRFQIAVAALILFLVVTFVADTTADANIFDSFRQTIMDVLHIGGNGDGKTKGVESVEEQQSSKPDLMLELQERVIDNSNIYLLVKIVAPTNIKFDKKITFDYFALAKGTNYNADQVISGATDCRLLEVKPGKENEATYVMQLSSDEEIEEGSMVTAYFKDLMIDPSDSGREMLVEGMWSISFEANYSVSKKVEIDGTDEMIVPFLEKQAYVKKVEITPLGMVIRSDVSEVPYDLLGVSDTRLRIRLRMIDGSEILLMSPDLEEPTEVQSSSTSYSNKGKKVYQRNKFEFEETIDVAQVIGLYIEDLYIPVKD